MKGTFSFFFSLIVLINFSCAGTPYAENVKGVALEGYDVVSYFKYRRPVKGNPQYMLKDKELTWYFANQENLESFNENPERYLPQYEGWCAWAMTEGRFAGSDPSIYNIYKGKLYLLCSQDALRKWEANLEKNIQLANDIWYD